MQRLALRIVIAAALLLPLQGCVNLRGFEHFRAGTAALDQGDASLAVFELQAAATLLPEVSEVHNHLGLAYASSGDLSLARGAFQRAVDLDCDNAPAQSNLALAEAVERGEVPAEALLGRGPPVPAPAAAASRPALDRAKAIP